MTSGGRLVGSVTIPNYGRPISDLRLCDALMDELGYRLLNGTSDPGHTWAETIAAIRHRYAPAARGRSAHSDALPDDVTVSIVLATRDRPDELRECLRCLTGQRTARRVEIVVVDNNPASGLTAAVTSEFRGIRLVEEPRPGLSYARNAGITACGGEIIVAVDDDVRMPEDWLETLIAPFARNDVMTVTGNVLPFELKTRAQRTFEIYGGLGRGLDRRDADRDWFDSFHSKAVPTWELGATANAAFRAGIFADPDIGLLREELGPGSPAGCGEDTYLFYKVLKQGHTIVYEPEAFVWHAHRREMPALRRQIFDYSKGHVAYHLLTLLEDNDLRALRRIALSLPRIHLGRIAKRALGRGRYPLSLSLLEIAGNLAGPWALWRARHRVRRLGRSRPYVPVVERAQIEHRGATVPVG